MSKINYNALAVDGLKEVFLQVSESCRELNIEFIIVGAIARNIWYVHNDMKARGTKDIDFGIYVPHVDQYNKLRAALVDNYGYVISSQNAFCLMTPDEKQIDLLPFGEIENEGQVMIEGKGLTRISLDGFNEVYQFGATEVLIGEETYKSCSIPGIVILKLIAFDDRPNRRIKDVIDINSICLHYPSIETELIWNEYNDLYEQGLEHQEVGVVVLGSEMKKMIKGNKKLEERLLGIFDRAIKEDSALLSLMIDDPEQETLDMKRNLINYLKMGFIQA